MDEPRRIVILGKTGSGKSSLANTIFGKGLFKINHTPTSETSNCERKNKSVKGRQFTLVDTPGFFDTNLSEGVMKPEILKCITECAPGPHAVLIVLKVEKSTEQEQAVIDKIKDYCSEEVFKYAMVVFTHGDQLSKGQTIHEFVKENESLSDLVKKCGDRCHVIDNKYWNRRHHVKKKKYRSNKFQVKEILKTLNKMVAEQKGDYTNDVLQEVEQEIQQEEEQIRQSSTNMSKKKIREEAKDKVFEKLSIKFAGIATGALLGALFGVATWTVVVLNAVKTATADSAGDDTVARGAGPLSCAIAAPIAAPGFVMAVAAGIPAGGVVGYHASKGADTPKEAAKMAVEAVVDGAGIVVEKTTDFLNKCPPKKIKHVSPR